MTISVIVVTYVYICPIFEIIRQRLYGKVGKFSHILSAVVHSFIKQYQFLSWKSMENQ